MREKNYGASNISMCTFANLLKFNSKTLMITMFSPWISSVLLLAKLPIYTTSVSFFRFRTLMQWLCVQVAVVCCQGWPSLVNRSTPTSRCMVPNLYWKITSTNARKLIKDCPSPVSYKMFIYIHAKHCRVWISLIILAILIKSWKFNISLIYRIKGGWYLTTTRVRDDN